MGLFFQRRLCAGLLIFFISWYVQAELQVEVVEKGSGEPVADATVIWQENQQHEQTNADGSVSFDTLQWPDQVRVLSNEFETLNLTIQQQPKKSKLKFYLEPRQFELNGLVVYGQRNDFKKYDIGYNELRRTPGSFGDPIRVLNSLPGITPMIGLSGQMYIRGSEFNDNIVFVDGIPVGYLFHLFGLTSTINPALVNNMDLFLSGAPVNYSDSIGGVIDIQLRQPQGKKLHSAYDVSFLQASAMAEKKWQHNPRQSTAYTVSMRRSYFDWLAQSLGIDQSENQFQLTVWPRYSDMQTYIKYQYASGSIGLIFLSAVDEAAMDLGNNAAGTQDIVGTLGLNNAYQSLGMNWQQRFSKHWKLQTQFSVSPTRDDYQLGRNNLTQQQFFIQTPGTQSFAQSELQFSGNSHRLRLGGEIRTENIDYNITAPVFPPDNKPRYNPALETLLITQGNYQTVNAAPFLSWRIQGETRSWLELGWRSSYWMPSNGIAHFSHQPRVHFNLQLGEYSSFYGSWGRYSQRPSLLKRIPGYGDPDLQLEKATQRSLGFSYDSPQSVFKMEIYEKRFDDLAFYQDIEPLSGIEPSIEKPTAEQLYASSGEGRAHGVEFLLKRKPRGRNTGWISYTYARSFRQDLTTKQHWPHKGDRPHTLNFVWSQAMPGWFKRWTLGFNSKLASGAPYTKLVGSHEPVVDSEGNFRIHPIYHSRINADRFPNYFRLDLRMDRYFLFNHSKILVFFELMNVTQHKNYIAYNYGETYQYIDNPIAITEPSTILPVFGFEMEL